MGRELAPEDHGEARQSDREGRCRRRAVDEVLHEADHLAQQGVGVHREAEQLGELPDQDGEREPVHVADLGRPGQQVRDEPEAEHAASIVMAPTISASIEA